MLVVPEDVAVNEAQGLPQLKERVVGETVQPGTAVLPLITKVCVYTQEPTLRSLPVTVNTFVPVGAPPIQGLPTKVPVDVLDHV